MPKKKLTKTQVNKKLQSVRRALYDLFLDKFAYGPGSLMPMSAKKIELFHKDTVSAILRLKK
jgi:hypothetical protein